ncbi:DUF2288 family protein [Tamilnaduibacter salinus]|nr:DUF2288 family protein [Tamilnaduibacter salinus]
MADGNADDVRSKLNLETARIPWKELQTYFARGHVVYVARSLDLLAVAETLTADDRSQLETWMKNREVGDVPADLAHGWYEADASVWAVVVAPWVLVQDSETRN